MKTPYAGRSADALADDHAEEAKRSARAVARRQY
jgi:hypothetical protein